jgi:quercetin dioxygenase-like cupin family protein
MRVAHASDVDWYTPSEHRGTGIEFKRLLAGTDGAPDNYEMSLVRFPGVYRTPRHRHNHDQIRLALDGDLNYSPGKYLHAGCVGYFPEGTPYGAQEVTTNPLTMAVQFGGAAGQGFFGYDSLARGYAELAALGEFRDGIWRGPDVSTGRIVKVDGYQAVWEHLAGRKMFYADPAYSEPVIMVPHRRPSSAQAPGAVVQHLGTFTAARTAIYYVRIEPQESYSSTAGPAGQLVWSGSVHTDAGTLQAHDGAHLDPATSAELRTEADSAELIVVDLPKIPT